MAHLDYKHRWFSPRQDKFSFFANPTLTKTPTIPPTAQALRKVKGSKYDMPNRLHSAASLHYITVLYSDTEAETKRKEPIRADLYWKAGYFKTFEKTKNKLG